MIRFFLILSSFVFLVSCVSTSTTRNTLSPKRSIPLSVKVFVLESEGDNSIPSKISYRLQFENFRVAYNSECFIYGDCGELLSKGKVRVEKKYFIVDFQDYICHKEFRYRIESHSLTGVANESFEGIIENPFYPKELTFEVPRVVTTIGNGERTTKFHFFSTIELGHSNSDLRVKIISPDMRVSWDVIVDNVDLKYIANSEICYSKHPAYINNGDYTIQYFLGKYGVIQKSFKLSDLYDNYEGKNYGATTALITDVTQKEILFEVSKVDLRAIVLELFDVENKVFISDLDLTIYDGMISKKELFKLINSTLGFNKKIKRMKDYSCRLKAEFQRRDDSIVYITTSDFYTIKFPLF